MACQMAGNVWSCPATEQTMVRGETSKGGNTWTHIGNAVIPVPNPVSPFTKPPSSAPMNTSGPAIATSEIKDPPESRIRHRRLSTRPKRTLRNFAAR